MSGLLSAQNVRGAGDAGPEVLLLPSCEASPPPAAHVQHDPVSRPADALERVLRSGLGLVVRFLRVFRFRRVLRSLRVAAVVLVVALVVVALVTHDAILAGSARLEQARPHKVS
jgi:hypothetical protein